MKVDLALAVKNFQEKWFNLRNKDDLKANQIKENLDPGMSD